MLHVILWKWQQLKHRDTYTAEHVNIVSAMIRANLVGVPHRVLCITDEPHGIMPPTEIFPLWEDHNDLPNATGRHLPSCYRRLKMFDYETQLAMGCQPGDRLAWIDLDTIVLKPLGPIFAKIDATGLAFAGWGVRGLYHRLVFNGSFVSIRCSEKLSHIWQTFDSKKSPRETVTLGFLGSDQGWISRHFSKSADACAVSFPDFVSYPREVRRVNTLDQRARVVFFHGSRKPWMKDEQLAHTWIKQHWRAPL